MGTCSEMIVGGLLDTFREGFGGLKEHTINLYYRNLLNLL